MRVAVAMSGGVDSSVAALLLKQAGHDVVGATFRLFGCDLVAGKNTAKMCCSRKDVMDAVRVAAALDIPHTVLDFCELFEEKVIAPFAKSYGCGETPNPCILCNRHIKFDAFLAWARERGIDAIATGHHATIEEADGAWHLRAGLDAAKDQTYFLFHLDQETMPHVLFPVGNLTKPQARELAALHGLEVASKGESQEICFTAGDDYAAFLIAHRAFRDKPGEIVLEDGSVLGAHAGLFRYTIGQRKGLGIAAPEPLYVVAKEMATNRLIVGPRKALACLGVTVREVVWTAGYVPSPGATLKVRIRYRSPSVAARLEASGERTFTVWFDEPVFGVAPGQAAVLYHDGEVLGGGWIAQSHRIKALSHSKGRVFIDTYGCRTNAADSSAIATELVSRGLHIAREADEAEVVVVNSCTVTHAATRDAGKGLRRARRARPDARFVLVGCLPAAQPGHRAENEADQVVSGNAPAAVADAVQRAMGLVPSVTRGQDVASPFGPPRTRFPLEATGNLSRINVKIQQGCDCRCAYCIVPDARGEPVSRPAKEIMAEVALAMEAGYPEVVVTGTNLAAYGRDQDDGTTLVRLMEMLEGLPQGRLRLSSLEPDSSLLPVLDRVARSRKWCRHLHLALQHGADPILTAMGRPCNFGVFRGLAKHAEGMIPGLALGMDVIVGFPGESEELFESSRRAIETLPFAYLHVFAWSPRPGTRAEALGERPSVVGTRERSRILRGLSDRRMAAFTASQVGTPAVLLVERRRDKREGKLIGLSDNYLRVLLEGPDNWMGKLVQCRLEQARSGVLLGGDARVVG